MINNIPISYNGVCDVEFNFQTYFKMLTNKCLSLFKWEGLPETVDERFLMEQLILRGKVAWFADKGNIYALNGDVGGEPNCYYQPTQFIIANPIIGSRVLTIRHKDGSQDLNGLDGVLMVLTDLDNDIQAGFNGGLYGLIYQTAGLLADNISSLNVAQINGRATVAFTADSEALANSAEEVLFDIYRGKPYKVLSQDIMEKITATPLGQTGNNSTLMTLIEARAQIWQGFYSELGIGYAGNLKRERVNTAEVGLQKGNLDINVYNMLKCLRSATEKVNEMFGTSISVELNDEVFYDGSGNATLGEVEEELQAETVEETSEETPEENEVETVEETLEEKAEDKKEDREDERD